MKQITTTTLILNPHDNERMASLCGRFDEHLTLLETNLEITISIKNNKFTLSGTQYRIDCAKQVLTSLYKKTANGHTLEPKDIQACLQVGNKPHSDVHITTKKITINTRNQAQSIYLHNIQHNTVTFGVGPAGTGKTFLAVAAAVAALERQEITKIILVRPVVEAGEKLGFLPGDLAQKIDPYLRPIYDALFLLVGFNKTQQLIEQHVVEIVPLAYMRGRTLSDAFIILDEGQNATKQQMKMFLTRIGIGSTVVITGDVTQVDLPKHTTSGLAHVIKLLKNIPNISFTFFTANDVVRHTIVQQIVTAYEEHEASR
ncbi:MAG: phosphate starvation-inducible protein PhoH [Legionellales bacterium]|nr:MAG: phosphate starvation-inducible protein PhoH [Legionellales bacterium]